MKRTPFDHYNRAVHIFGSENKLAKAMGVRQSQLWKWRRRGVMPAEYCLLIEHATKGRVTRVQLRPDIFGPIVPALNDAPFHIPLAGGWPAATGEVDG